MREKLIEMLKKSFGEQSAKRGILTAPHTADYLIANGVTIDPASLRPKGEWISVKNPQWPAYSHDKCNICGWWNTKNALCYDGNKKPGHSLNFCPNCGADMRGESHE